MIIITRQYKVRPATGDIYETKEFKVFADDDIRGVQKYLSQFDCGVFDFKKL